MMIQEIAQRKTEALLVLLGDVMKQKEQQEEDARRAALRDRREALGIKVVP